jgi:sugar lactone lactonase YvrE
MASRQGDALGQVLAHSADSLSAPDSVALDSSGDLYVVDFNNNRVLFYPAGSTTATRVYGQAGSFTTNTPNKGGLSADSLDAPVGVALDSSGNLYVADTNNNRVLKFAGPIEPG